jgi:hypothetical protein
MRVTALAVTLMINAVGSGVDWGWGPQAYVELAKSTADLHHKLLTAIRYGQLLRPKIVVNRLAYLVLVMVSI